VGVGHAVKEVLVEQQSEFALVIRGDGDAADDAEPTDIFPRLAVNAVGDEDGAGERFL
jgi:hypothetical protein